MRAGTLQEITSVLPRESALFFRGRVLSADVGTSQEAIDLSIEEKPFY